MIATLRRQAAVYIHGITVMVAGSNYSRETCAATIATLRR